MAPAAAASLVIASPGLLSSLASAEPVLPPRTADEIIADVLSAKPVAFTGEVVQTMELGLPSLGFEPGVDFTNPNSIWALASGSNTWRLWYDGGNSYRVAIIRGQAESDLISNGSVLWAWSSESQTAVRSELEPGTSGDNLPLPAGSPQEAAVEVLRELEQYSAVSTDSNVRVAGRDAYELVITPSDDQTRVAQVRLAVDAETSLPLRVIVSSTTSATPAIEIGFTKINYSAPNPSVFEFTPPPNAEVIEAGHAGELESAERPEIEAPGAPADDVVPSEDAGPLTQGEGWSRVTVTPPMEMDTGSPSPMDNPMVQLLPRVQGDWGSGVVLDGTLISVVIADDGRMAFGAVAPEALYQALAK